MGNGPKRNPGPRPKKLKKVGGVSVKALKKYYPVIERISKTRSKSKLNQIFDKLTRTGVDSICECIYNALYSTKLSPKSLQYLRGLSDKAKHRARYLALSPRSKAHKKKKEVLKQSGGDITDIIAAIIPLLVPLIFGF